ncbi:hypothetical protein G3N58_31190 [Paraburkholderia sp. Ac-20342]|nr:hypothetical protein [Paraburkholderia sp. Ac-20342]NIF80795.1 hypothetical protein [Paraburkholderia sp. Cy-641]
MAPPPPRSPTLAQRELELRRLHLPESKTFWRPSRDLCFSFAIGPSAYSPLYRCLLVLPRSGVWPSLYVIKPDLVAVAHGKRPPHIYSHENGRTELCLWYPKGREWNHAMKLADTYIAWTAEWLWYFEDWLITGEWAGGGEHPE